MTHRWGEGHNLMCREGSGKGGGEGGHLEAGVADQCREEAAECTEPAPTRAERGKSEIIHARRAHAAFGTASESRAIDGAGLGSLFHFSRECDAGRTEHRQLEMSEYRCDPDRISHHAMPPAVALSVEVCGDSLRRTEEDTENHWKSSSGGGCCGEAGFARSSMIVRSLRSPSPGGTRAVLLERTAPPGSGAVHRWSRGGNSMQAARRRSGQTDQNASLKLRIVAIGRPFLSK